MIPKIGCLFFSNNSRQVRRCSMMRHLLILIGSFCLLSFAAIESSHAQPQTTPSQQQQQNAIDPTGCGQAQANTQSLLDEILSSGGTICPCAPKPGLWIERIVWCFSAAPGGLIDKTFKAIVNDANYQSFTRAVVGSTIMLALVLLGMNMILGSVYSLKKDLFTLGLKIGGVLLFFDNFTYVHESLLGSMSSVTQAVSDAASGFGDICSQSGANPTVWARWDCLFQKLLGFVNNALFVGIIGFLSSFLFTSGPGAAVFFGGTYIIMAIFLMAMRLVYTYLVATIAIAFLFLLAPLVVPAIFFSKTYQKFETWFKLIIAYALQPPLLILFAVLMLTTLEFAIFVGPTSLFGALSNTSPSQSMSFQQVMFTNSSGNGILGSLSAAVTKQNDFDPSKNIEKKTFPDAGVTLNPEDYADDAINQDTTKTGWLGNLRTAKNSSQQSEAKFNIGFRVAQINAEKMVASLSGRNGANDNGLTVVEWFKNILFQIGASAILVFILYNIMQNAPDFTHNLVSQRFRRVGKITRSQMLGEGTARKSLATAKESSEQARKTKDKDEAVKSTLSKAYESIVGRR